MTIIAVTLNERGTFTMVADKLVGSNRRWIGKRSKIHTLHLDKTIDIAFAGNVFELDHDELIAYIVKTYKKTHSIGNAKFVTRTVTEYLNSKDRKVDICALVTDGHVACSIDLDKTEQSAKFVPSFSNIKPSRGDLAWIELNTAEMNSHSNNFGYAKTDELLKAIALLHELAGYPDVLPTVGKTNG